MNNSRFLVAVIGLLGCTSNDCCTVVDTQINLQYLDSNSTDWFLLHPEENPNNLRVYYLKNGRYELVDEVNQDHRYGYSVATGSASTRFTLFPSHYYTENTSTTVVELPQVFSDTLVGQFHLKDTQEKLEKLWVNGQLTTREVILGK